MMVRRVPPNVARQVLVNKVLGWPEVLEAETIDRDLGDLEIVASQVPVPELLPYRYVYVNLYVDAGGNFYAEVDKQAQAGRRRAPKTVPH